MQYLLFQLLQQAPQCCHVAQCLAAEAVQPHPIHALRTELPMFAQR